MASAFVLVDKATSDFLLRPDWAMNLAICDTINSDHGQAKEVVKAVKKRIGNKNPRVQLLALILLETMIKNCGEVVYFLVAERAILQEMVKIVRKKTDMQVRDKILVLLDSWQGAFGGPNGKYPQYFWAYEELRRSGVQFPERVREASPIFTPPVTRQLQQTEQGNDMPQQGSITLDEAMASESQTLSLQDLKAAHGVVEVLAEMIKAIDSNDKQAVKEEVIVELVEQCRSIQKRNMQLIDTATNEELLCQGLALNDELQALLAKHDAIASGTPLPPDVSLADKEEDEEEEDDFSQLAKRKLSSKSIEMDAADQGSSTGDSSGFMNQLALPAPEHVSETSNGTNDAVDLPERPKPVKISASSKHEEELIDLFSGTNSNALSPLTPSTMSQTASNEQQEISSSPSMQKLVENSIVADAVQHSDNDGSIPLQQQQQPNINPYNSYPSYNNTQAAQSLSSYSVQQQQYNSWNSSQLYPNNYIAPWAAGYNQYQNPYMSTFRRDIPVGQSPSFSQAPPSSNFPSPPWMRSSPGQAIKQEKTASENSLRQSRVLEPQRSFNIPSQTPSLQKMASFNIPTAKHSLSSEQQNQLAGTMQNMSLNKNTGIEKRQSNQRSYVTSNQLFDDLIDMKSATVNFKTAGVKPNTSLQAPPNKEGTS